MENEILNSNSTLNSDENSNNNKDIGCDTVSGNQNDDIFELIQEEEVLKVSYMVSYHVLPFIKFGFYFHQPIDRDRDE